MYSRIMPDWATPGRMMEEAATRERYELHLSLVSSPRMAGLSM